MSPRKLATTAAKSALLMNREGSGVETAPEILEELFDLLEEYGPLWYTEDHHNRATRALAEVARRRGLSLIQGQADQKRVN
jgi:hypothetical protein